MVTRAPRTPMSFWTMNRSHFSGMVPRVVTAYRWSCNLDGPCTTEGQGAHREVRHKFSISSVR